MLIDIKKYSYVSANKLLQGVQKGTFTIYSTIPSTTYSFIFFMTAKAKLLLKLSLIMYLKDVINLTAYYEESL
jgi:hypothetical protein